MRTPLPARVEAGVAAAICAMLASCGSPGDSGASAQFGTPVVTAIGTPSIPYSLAFGDFDRDRRLDILSRNGEGTLLLLRGNGDGTFGPVERIEGLVAAAGAAMGDLDRDGNLDLVVIGCPAAPCAREAVALFTMAGTGNGTFRAPVALPTPYPIAEGFLPLIADFNVDGWPDVAVVWWRPAPPIFTEWKELGIFLGTASGMTPAPHLTVSLGPLRPGHVVGVRTIDVDADGRPDLMGYGSSIEGGAGFAHAKLGLGDGTFGPAVPIDVHAPADVPASDAWHSQGGFHVGDLDGDGNPDIGMRWTDDSALSLLYGNGDGTFRAAVDYALDAPGWITGLVDLNGDGRPDLVLAGASGVVTMLNTR